MSNLALEWSAPEQDSPLAALIPPLLKEGRRRIALLATVFAGIALLALAAGLLLPKRYTSSTSILVEDSNIIRPLLEGRAVPTGVSNRANIARQVAYSHKVMDEIIKVGGWWHDDMDPAAKERLIEEITGRTGITNPRENLIQISYTDRDAHRAYEVTQRFAELVISESLAAKEREGRDAYAFIDTQVQRYHQKLVEAEANLEQYRKANPDARPGVDVNVANRLNELQRQIDGARMELGDLGSQEAALQAQLSGENEISVVRTRSSQLLARMAELEAEHDRLLMTYTEQHPDVVRVNHQLEDLRAQLERADAMAASGAGASQLDGPANFHPLYAELKSKLAAVRTSSAAVRSRLASAEALQARESGRRNRIASSESQLAELSRDYEVNRDLYQDLLKRRENARLSMNLDAEQSGLTFRIQEPARVPARGNGLRLMHVAAAGLAMAIFAPLVLLVLYVKFDPRVRSTAQIEQKASLPVLGTVPRQVTVRERRQDMRRYAIAATLFVVVPLAYATALVTRLVQTL